MMGRINFPPTVPIFLSLFLSIVLDCESFRNHGIILFILLCNLNFFVEKWYKNILNNTILADLVPG